MKPEIKLVAINIVQFSNEMYVQDLVVMGKNPSYDKMFEYTGMISISLMQL